MNVLPRKRVLLRDVVCLLPNAPKKFADRFEAEWGTVIDREPRRGCLAKYVYVRFESADDNTRKGVKIPVKWIGIIIPSDRHVRNDVEFGPPELIQHPLFSESDRLSLGY